MAEQSTTATTKRTANATNRSTTAKKAAQTALQQQANQLKNDPEKKARLERLVKGPVPDHVARAAPHEVEHVVADHTVLRREVVPLLVGRTPQ